VSEPNPLVSQALEDLGEQLRREREANRREISNENWRLLDLKLREIALAFGLLTDQITGLRDEVRELRGEMSGRR
jgi:hypothetical protein